MKTRRQTWEKGEEKKQRDRQTDKDRTDIQLDIGYATKHLNSKTTQLMVTPTFPENETGGGMRHRYMVDERGMGPTQRMLVEMRKKAEAAEDVGEYPQDFKRHPKVQ